VLALFFLVASIALADSVNPSTVLPALYLSTAPHAVRKIASFTAGVALTSAAFGVIFVAGPGQLILGVLPHPTENAKHLVEVGVGIALIALAIALWRHGERLTERIPKGESEGRRGSFALGAGIMALELPTAFPYFAALAAIIGSDRSLPIQIGYVLLFNAIFVLPEVAILMLRARATDRAERRLQKIGDWVRSYAHVAVAVIAGLAGVGILIVGLADLR
jgi:cytochrome c biogenesis protein CcdA